MLIRNYKISMRIYLSVLTYKILMLSYIKEVRSMTVVGAYADGAALGGLASNGRAGIGDYGEEGKGKGER